MSEKIEGTILKVGAKAKVVVDVQRCRICGERVEYPTGLNLRSGAQVHIACARANTAGIGCRVPKVDPRMVEVAS